MSFLNKIDRWGEIHHSKWVDILRILLGILICAKGFYFMEHTEYLEKIIPVYKDAIYFEYAEKYVGAVQLMGGALIVLGLITRIAIIFQIPVLIGAIVSTGLRHGLLLYNNSDLPLAIIILFLLFFFLVEGSGPISMDGYLKRHHPDDL